jgi:hypothetical protein
MVRVRTTVVLAVLTACQCVAAFNFHGFLGSMLTVTSALSAWVTAISVVGTSCTDEEQIATTQAFPAIPESDDEDENIELPPLVRPDCVCVQMPQYLDIRLGFPSRGA